MKKISLSALTFLSLNALAAPPTLDNLSKGKAIDVADEFAVNFSHTAASSLETKGDWGTEAGLVGGVSGSPTLRKAMDDADEYGEDYKKLFHGGLVLRGHGPWDIFAEASFLPSQTVNEMDVDNKTFALGWNAGAYFNLDYDLSLGANFSSSELSFDQDVVGGNDDLNATVKINSSTKVFWVGAGRTYGKYNPYFKLGSASTDSDIEVDSTSGTIFNYTSAKKESVSSSGEFLVLGGNMDVSFLRLGLEVSQTIGVRRLSGKLTYAF